MSFLSKYLQAQPPVIKKAANDAACFNFKRLAAMPLQQQNPQLFSRFLHRPRNG